jgi:hypothetical protein
MIMMKKILFGFVCVLLFSFASLAQKNKYQSLKQMDWLAGYWKGMYKGAPFYEAWIKAHDSLMVNLTIEIKNTDTIVREHGFIRFQNGNIIYGGSRAVWQLTELTGTKMVFENDTLKYSNKIIWSHSSNDHWLTELQNPNDVIYYDLERVLWLKRVVDNFISRARRSGIN